MSESNKQLKRKELCLSDRVLVIKELETKSSQSVVAKKFGISQSQVSRILKNKEKILSAHHQNKINPSRKRARQSNHAEVDEALLKWFKEASNREIQISGPMLREKAKDLGKLIGIDFEPSLSWVQRWRDRVGIVSYRQQSKRQSYKSEVTEEWIASVWARILEQYSVSDIYNCAETGLYFHALPAEVKCIQNERFSNNEKVQEHLAVLLMSNMNGLDKHKLFVVGRPEKPHWYKEMETLPVVYRSNISASMTSLLFQNWLLSFDKSLKAQGRKICLLLHNCPAHKVEESCVLKCIELIYVPPKTTFVQPLDQGVIRNFKHYYRRRFLQKFFIMVDSDETNKNASEVVHSLSLLSVINLMSAAWNDISAELIQNCFFWNLTLTVPDESSLGFPSDEIPLNFTEEAYKKYVSIDDELDVTSVELNTKVCKKYKENGVDSSDTINCTKALPENIEVLKALDTIRLRLNSQGMEMNEYFQLEKQLLDRMSKDIQLKSFKTSF